MCWDSHGVRRKVQVEVAGIIPAVGDGAGCGAWRAKFAISGVSRCPLNTAHRRASASTARAP